MKKIIYTILAATTLGMAVTSCNDQLDIPQKGVYESEGYYLNDEGAQSGLALAMNFSVNMAFDVICGINLLGDDIWAGGANSGDQPGMHQLNGFYISTENNMVESFYKSCYQMVYFTNLLIDQLADYEAATPVMKQCLAEAYVLRGWAEFYLGVLWGNPPIITHTIYSNDGVTNSEYGEMLEQAATDFRTAINSGYLPEKPALGDLSNAAHCTLATAQAFLGKVYLFQGKYPEAAAMLDNIITSQKYALWDGPYEDIIKAASNWTDEGIFEANCPVITDWDTGPAFLSYVYIYGGWRGDDFDYNDLDREAFPDFDTDGYGFFNPQGALAKALIESDGADGYRTTAVLKDQAFVEGVMGIKKKPGAAHGHGLYCGWKNRFQYSDNSLNAGSGWSPFPATNFRYMRYAEVLLSAAEAHLQSGNAPKALDYVNQVRTRAKAPLYSAIDMDKIKLERQVELCMEGQRFMDLVRWGDAEKVLGKQGQDIEMLSTNDKGEWILVPDPASNPNYGYKSYNQYLPYPKKEVDQNPNITQHVGYGTSVEE